MTGRPRSARHSFDSPSEDGPKERPGRAADGDDSLAGAAAPAPAATSSLAAHHLGGEGPGLLVVHAVGFCAQVLAPLARELAKAFRVTGADLAGHGQSPPPLGDNYSWADQADGLARLAQRQHGPLWAFGHSAGAAILLAAEARHAGTFAGLVCYEPPLWSNRPPPELTEALVSGAMRRRARFGDEDEALVYLAGRRGLSSIDPECLQAFVRHGLRPDGGGLTLRCSPAAEAATYQAGHDHAGLSLLGDLGCPVVLLTGAQPPLGTRAVLDDQLRAIAGSQVVVIDGLGHFGPLEDPVAVARAVAQAIADRPGR
ncbi:MAG: alpha/beta fold hydrolase [Acidimicrobiales bacterium]